MPTNSKVTVQCEGAEIKPFAGLFGSVGYNFVNDLGTIAVPPEGGTVTLHKEGSYGPLDATVVVKVLPGTG